jgi:hypothetical protein
LLTHVFGDAFAPFALGWLADALAELQTALLVMTPTVIAAGLIAGIGCRWVGLDRRRVLDLARTKRIGVEL